MKTVELLRSRVMEYMKNDQDRLAIHDAVLEVLKEKWTGKQLNKRIAAQVEEKLKAKFPESTPVIYYNKEGFRRIGIKVWGVLGYDYDKRLEMDITHESNGYVVDPEAFDTNLDARHGSAARERIIEYEKDLKNNLQLAKIADAVDQLKEAKKNLEKLTNSDNAVTSTVRYYAEELAGIK